MKEPVLADETNIEGYLLNRGGAKHCVGTAVAHAELRNHDSHEASCENSLSAVPHQSYADVVERCRVLLRSLPTLDTAVQFQRVWSIPEALEQYESLSRQNEMLAEAGGNRLKVRRMQRKFAQLHAEETLELLRSAGAGRAASTAVVELSRRAATDLRDAVKLLELEEVLLKEKLLQSAKEAQKSRDALAELKAATEDSTVRAVPANPGDAPPARTADAEYFYCTNCKVGGHGARFSEYLLRRPNWRIYPAQVWFKDDKGSREYYCPLGRHLVDFTDETRFSRVSMYIKGHIWMEDKTKLYEVVPDMMPDTYVIDDLKWRNGRAPPPDDKVNGLPWFVKEADRNWGTSVHVCRRPSECIGLAKPGALYAVQQHIAEPLCMDDGRKCHIKFYILLIGREDGFSWDLYTYRDGYLSISPNRWSPDDLSKETQVTIIRSERINSWKHWSSVYPKCKTAVAEVLRRLITEGKLQGQPGRTQFEIMSADYIVDERGGVWLFEFNTSPVLKDPKDSPDVHDGDLILGALSIVLPWEGGDPGKWDHALHCESPAPKTLGTDV